MYAVFETGGKQYRAAAGDLVKVEMLGEEDGATVTFDKVLLVNQDGKVTVGTPTVANATVSGEVVTAEQKDKKVVVFKMKRRKHSRTKNGHRQRHSLVKITGINA
jgi:large subunit ribosomal protein L21